MFGGRGGGGCGGGQRCGAGQVAGRCGLHVTPASTCSGNQGAGPWALQLPGAPLKGLTAVHIIPSSTKNT